MNMNRKYVLIAVSLIEGSHHTHTCIPVAIRETSQTTSAIREVLIHVPTNKVFHFLLR